MPTTTIRLTEELKTRVAVAAKRAGTSAHGFILEAIAEKTASEERRADFDAVAEERYAPIASSGKTILGRPVTAGKRELVIGRRAHGYVAHYRYVTEIDTVFVLAIQSQREAGYPKRDSAK